MNRMWLKLTEISGSEVGDFRLLCEKCQVGDVTVGGRRVVSISGFLFPVGHDLNRSKCSGDFLGNVYFRSERCSKVGKKYFDLSIQQGSDGLSCGRWVFFYC